MDERTGRGEKRKSFKSLELDEGEEERSKSLHRRSRSQSISARARKMSSATPSQRGSMESIELDTEGAKFTVHSENDDRRCRTTTAALMMGYRRKMNL